MINQDEDNTNAQPSSVAIEDDKHEDQDLKFVFHKKNLLLGDPITTTINLTRFKNDFSIRKTFNKIAFIGFCLGAYEIVTDLLSSYNFIQGDD